MSNRITKLPKWAQYHIRQLENRVERAEKTIPWTKPGMQWLTILHPDTRPASDKGESRVLFFLEKDHARSLCSIGPNDCVFIGRGTEAGK